MLLECVSCHHEQLGKPCFDSHRPVRHKNLLQRTREIALQRCPIGQLNACLRQPLEETGGDGVRLFLTELIDRLALVPVSAATMFDYVARSGMAAELGEVTHTSTQNCVCG